MIERWLMHRREKAAYHWHWVRRCSLPLSEDVARARRRFDRWDALLDLWTGRR